MLIYQYKERRRKNSHSNDCVNDYFSTHHHNRHQHHHHYQNRHHYKHHKYITFTLSFLVHLLIATTIMAASPDHSVAMNVLTDRIHVREELSDIADPQVLSKTSIENHQIILNEKIPSLSLSSSSSSNKLNGEGQSMKKAHFEIKAHRPALPKHTINRDQSNNLQENHNSRMCNCSHGKWATFQRSNCMEICSENVLHSKKFKRNRKPTKRKSMEKREHAQCLTLIYRMDAISNNRTQSNKIIVPNQSSGMVLKFHRKPIQRKTIDRFNGKASSNDGNAYETNKHHQIDSTATNFHKMGFHLDATVPTPTPIPAAPASHLVNFKNIYAQNKRMKNNAAAHDKNVDNAIMLKYEIIDSNGSRNVKRKARSIPAQTTTKMPSNQFNGKSWAKWQTTRQQNATLTTTTVSSFTKSTTNAIFDSSKLRGEAVEINAIVFNANRSIDSTTSSK